MYKQYPFAHKIISPAYQRAALSFAQQRIAARSAPTPAARMSRAGYRMGNVGDYINSPGFPGSSTMWLYGMGDITLNPSVDTGTVPAVTDSSWSFSNLIKGASDLVTTIATTGLPAYMQYELYKVNLERSKQGLAPLSADQYAPSMKVGADTATLRTAQVGIGTVAVLGLGALALVLLLRRRR